MKDLKHLIYFERLLENADNELVEKAKAEGGVCLGYTCFHIPEVLLNVDNCFSTRLRAPNTGSIDIATYYMSNYTCEYARALLERAIVGGYRFLLCDHLPIDDQGQVDTPTSELFHYSERFVKDYLPYTIELGRSFVQPNYQPSKSLSKGMYSLDNLWDGLGSLIDIYPEAKYYFGKVTMYPTLERTSRDMILYFMQKHFPDREQLVTVRPELDLPILSDPEWLESVFNADNYRDNYRILVKQVRERGAAVPPLVNAYMNLSPTLRTFGTALNPGFGEVEETGILMTISDIFEEKVKRHLIYDKNAIPEHLKMPFYAN